MIATDTTNELGTTVAKAYACKRPLMEADAETLWAEIRELARNHDYPFAARILRSASTSTGRPTHVAVALAHAHMGFPTTTVRISKR